MLASTGVILPRANIDTLGLIMSSEHPSIMNRIKTSDRRRCSMSSGVTPQDECSVYHDFDKFHFLHSCPPFMNTKTASKVGAQVRTPYGNY